MGQVENEFPFSNPLEIWCSRRKKTCSKLGMNRSCQREAIVDTAHPGYVCPLSLDFVRNSHRAPQGHTQMSSSPISPYPGGTLWGTIQIGGAKKVLQRHSSMLHLQESGVLFRDLHFGEDRILDSIRDKNFRMSQWEAELKFIKKKFYQKFKPGKEVNEWQSKKGQDMPKSRHEFPNSHIPLSFQ